MTDLPKTFDPAEMEARWYSHWEDSGQFRPNRPGAEPWTIVNPPPNVTGILHIGHALDNTLQDILTRHARLKGKDALWVVGTDHAGIATQMVVERRMAEHQQKRTDFSREDFVAKVWEWKAESGGQITAQLRRLGCSMDWANERFTMDEGFSKAVLKVFVELHREGLLYRDKRLVNWDPGLGTAISDLEVETREVQGKFWHLSYPLADGPGSISVATTRPETMLADMAVAVHPGDERYTSLIGRQVRLPITGRLIPIVADEHADPELGSGAVKITPGHDFNDFEVGKRAGIEARDMLNMLDAQARVVQCGGIPGELLGLDRFEARQRVVALLEAGGHLERIEDRTIQTPYGDRSGQVIEPWLTDQWYVDAATLAKPAIEAVKTGRIRIVPKSWEKTFFNWMENIQPWCVSRQLWWGHRIPAWFGPVKIDDNFYYSGFQNSSYSETQWSNEIVVAYDEVELIEIINTKYELSLTAEDIDFCDSREEARRASNVGANETYLKGRRIAVFRDPDVLDTWFSSALWPFATMGWPEDGDRTLGGRYPNNVLISGFDILFFWDARMMMQGLHFMEDVPFRTLYLHGLVRAADGAKMSKSKGNTVDPLGLIDRYGADALRFFMAAMESQGRDIKMDEKRVEGYRNFGTKLWNAARFCQSNGIGASSTLEPPAATLAVNKWIVGETVACVQAVDLALADYRFDGAADAIYHFVWSRFCDWYLELIKPVLSKVEGPVLQQAAPSTVRAEPVAALPSSAEESAALRQAPCEREGGDADETRAVAGWVLDQILVLLHPFMPFITEELWHALGQREYDLIVAKWPMADARALDPEASREVDWLIDAISEVRATKVALDAAAKPMAVFIGRAQQKQFDWLDRNILSFKRMVRAQQVSVRTPHSLIELQDGGARVGWSIEDLLDAEGSGEVQLALVGIQGQLDFFGDVDVEGARERLSKGIAAAEKERDALAGRLGNASFVERAKPEAVDKARADHADKVAEAERLAAALARLG